MASLPSRTTASFDNIKPVTSLVLLDDEFNDMKGGAGFLNGGTTGKKLLIKTSDAADPPVDCDQVGAGPLARWKQNGSSKVEISNAGNLTLSAGDLTVTHGSLPVVRVTNTVSGKSLEFFVQDSGLALVNVGGGNTVMSINTTTREVTFNVSPTNVAAWSFSWFYDNLPPAVETTETQGRFIVPVGTAITITSITAVWAGGADSGASNIFTIKRRNSAGTLQADVGTVDVNTPAQNVLQSGAVSVTLTAGDQIYPLFTTRNTASETLVTISVRGTQKPT